MIVIFGEKREIRKQIRKIARREAERMMAEVQRISSRGETPHPPQAVPLPLTGEGCDGNVWEELEAYRGTDMSPDEILLASERLAAFEEAGLEPADVKVLVERDTAKEAVRKGEEKVTYCPECGGMFMTTPEAAALHPFCWDCGQRLKFPKEDA